MEDNQRQSTRFPIPHGRDAALLRVGRRSLMAQLVNTSAGGFSIVLAGDTAIVTGQAAVLGTPAGWCRVQVVSIGPDENGLRVGLQRTADLPVDWHRWWISRVWPFHRLRVRLPGLGWSHCALGGLIISGLVLGYVFWDGAAILDALPLAGHVRELPVFTGGRTTDASPSSPSGAATGGLWSTPQRLPDGRMRITHPLTNDLPDASLLLSRDVQAQLRITPEQRAEIESIVKANNEAVEAVYRQASDASSPAVQLEVARLRRSASEHAIAALSSEQQRQLKSIRRR